VADAKAQQIGHWDAVAPGWAAWLSWTERQFAPVTDWLIEAAAWAPGVRALDVACGAGYPALAAARLVGPGGRIVAIDISPAMLAAAAGAARDAGLDAVEVMEMDAEALVFDDRSFDAVTNVYGLMFSPDPARAIAEAHRVLDRGGRLAVVTWDAPSKSPFFSVITAIAAPLLGLAAPQPGAPGPFRFASGGPLESLLLEAGFRDVRVESRAAVVECASAADYVRMFTDLAWKTRAARLTTAQMATFARDVEAAVVPYTMDGRLQLTATSLCAVGRAAP
jgi:ubiquinone/menaquinone biosynthesis C-methylase UbiE